MSEPTIWDIAMGCRCNPPEKFVPYEEYKKLDYENARLKAEVETLRNLGIKLESMIDPLEAENARLEHVVNYWKVEAETDNARWLRVLEENERLKAEVERLTKQKAVYIDNDKVLAEMECLKAEVKEKTALIAELHKDAETSYRERMYDEHDINEKTDIINGLLRDKEKLKAQVERLTKAGDALAGEAIRLEYNNYWSEYEKVEDVCIDEVEAWHKAKGVQS